MHRCALLAAGAAVLTAAPACRPSIAAFGPSADAARRAADAALTAFAYRFYNVERDPRFQHARRRIARSALVPSRLYHDSTLWSVASDADSSRTLFVRSWYDSARYRFVPLPRDSSPVHVGDQRHVLRLDWLGGGDYEWNTAVEHAIGHATPAAIAAAIVATLTAAEDRTGAAARADAIAAFPRTSTHLARLFSIDTLLTVPADNGATDVTLGFRFRPDGVRARYPFLAAYVERYIIPAIWRIRVTDRAEATFVDLSGRDGRVTARLRSRDHRLVSLGAGTTPLPDSLILHAEFSAKWRMFRVGFSRLQGDFTLERGPNERAWMFRFRREPAWQLPLATRHLIRKPLRRPFEDGGIELRLAIRSGDGQTLSTRHSRTVVNESAITRWLGGLGASAFGAFAGRAELEQNLFLYEMFAALRNDIAAWRP
ncbi:MAG TPA: hypothetical protein VLE53_18965 [Gemmatimonadaceae bacterium]|nr:hypothetical protein [Gemmatimonadaceae bacterium]